jgi:hypothetical protein
LGSVGIEELIPRREDVYDESHRLEKPFETFAYRLVVINY